MPEGNAGCNKTSSQRCYRLQNVDIEHSFPGKINTDWVKGRVSTPIGEIVQVSTNLNIKDILGSWKVRWGINRYHYLIHPGLYCIGNPTNQSPVLVSANYKLSFDRLRRELSGLDVWILVIDTKGINVWCAAGKGTFGTEEIVQRIETTGLIGLVSHRTLILPQLSAPGVAAHEVLSRSGFRVVYGPVRASHIKAFIDMGMKATKDMRTVTFNFLDRLILTPMELVRVIRPVAIILTIIFVVNLLGIRFMNSFHDMVPYLGAILSGCVFAPVLLPWIPGRAFAWKGWLLGLIWALLVDAYYILNSATSIGWRLSLFHLLILPAISSYLAMNFTGSSTYTSLSGVKKEMRIWVPIIISLAGLGIVCMVVSSVIHF